MKNITTKNIIIIIAVVTTIIIIIGVAFCDGIKKTYENESLYIKVTSNSSLIDSDFVYGISNTINLNSFTYYMVKEIPARVTWNGQIYEVLIRSWDENIFSINTPSKTHCMLGLFSENLGEYAECYIYEPISNNEIGTLNCCGIENDIVINNDMSDKNYKYQDYLDSIKSGVIDKCTVVFVSDMSRHEKIAFSFGFILNTRLHVYYIYKTVYLIIKLNHILDNRHILLCHLIYSINSLVHPIF